MNVRVRLDITGVVQGVGFRPTVARIAAEHGVNGFVYNDAGSVHCELEGPYRAWTPRSPASSTTRRRWHASTPSASTRLEPHGDNGFAIIESRTGDDTRTLVPPDIAVCDDCLRELRDPADRRFGHPFITCTNCGPRYTLITDLPYDRPATTMAGFAMCTACASEYHDQGDRRFHAQTIACPDCGPRLQWWPSEIAPGSTAPDEPDPIRAAARALAGGAIVAIKGIGGFHLACRADDVDAVARLRGRKSRPAKPFAVMAANLGDARRIAVVGIGAAAALRSGAAPIVLVPRRGGSVVDGVAPALSDLGVMLAYSPIHHLLFDRLGPVPLVMTSANQGGSPIVFRDGDLAWIDGLADAVLTHDRPIHVPCEDSVLTVDDEENLVPLRRSRGYAPLPVSVELPGEVAQRPVILATGGDLKTTFCLMGADGHAHLSAHLGDMADPRTQTCFSSALEHLAFMTDRTPSVVACDLHPGYATTHWAQRHAGDRLELRHVQHHHAHAVALLAEHRRLGWPTIAVTYDGTGYGTDGTIWGGEFLAIPSDATQFTRVGHLLPFALPGGDGAARQPARIALDLLHRAGVAWDSDLPPVASLGPSGVQVLAQQIPRGVGCVPTTSMGRLFDAVASLLGVCQDVTYEGQAAIELEHLARGSRAAPLDFDISAGVLDPSPVILGLVAGLRSGTEVRNLAAAFHGAVIRATVRAATTAARAASIPTIGLTGGVFANRLLLEGVRNGLRDNDFEVLTHHVVPCNDGGLALGQAVVVAAMAHVDQSSESEGSGVCALESPAR